MSIFIIIFLILLLGRANSFLVGFELLNIDESQMMANAIRLHLNNYNILQFDGTSSGFLNSLILTWPSFFGLDITFLSTRFTALFIISLIFYFCYLYLRLEAKKALSLKLILPAVLLFAFTNDPDYQHYSSELLSTLFIIITLYGFKFFSETNKPKILLIGMFLLGMVIFSKTQIIPTALALCFSICFYKVWKKNYSIALKSLTLFSLPIMLIIFFYFSKGYFYDYYLNYFEFSKAVVSKYALGENIIGSEVTTQNVSNSNILNHFLFNSVFHYFYLKILLTIFLFLLMLNIKNLKKILNFNFLLIIICIFSVFFSIMITGAIYRHYLIPLVPLTSIFVGSIIIFNKKILQKSNIYKISIYFIFLIYISTFVFENKKFYAKKYKKNQLSIQNLNYNSPRIFDYLGVESGNIYIWGWAPQWYVLGYLYPSDRATISQKNIENYSNKDYFNQRLINDLTKNKPNIIIDSIKPKSFLYTSREYSVEKSPIKGMIEKEYVKIKNNNLECSDIYLTKANYQNLRKKLIKFHVNNSILKDKLDDFSITEDICDDSVIFNASSPNEVILELEPKSDPKKILILASKANRKKIELNVQFLNSKNNVLSKQVLLKKHPFWTKIILEDNEEPTSKIIIDISNLKKMNYGINEIKVYKY